jgi:hypothetical protein
VQRLVANVETLDDSMDRENCENGQAICSIPAEAKAYTYSAMVFDTKNKLVRYAQGCPSEVGFREYSFTKLPNTIEKQQID